MIINKKKLKKLLETKNQSRKRNAKTSKGKKINRSLNNRPSKNLRTGSVSRRHKTAKYQKGGLGNIPSAVAIEALRKEDGIETESLYSRLRLQYVGSSPYVKQLKEYVVAPTANQPSGTVDGYPFFKKSDYTIVKNPGGGDCLYYSLVTALEKLFPTKKSSQFPKCITNMTSTPPTLVQTDSEESFKSCQKAQEQVRLLLASYIKTQEGTNTVLRIPGFRQILISMGFYDYETRQRLIKEKVLTEEDFSAPDAEFSFIKTSVPALQIAADDKITVEDFNKIPFVKAVQSGLHTKYQRDGPLNTWNVPEQSLITGTIADNILYNGGIFGKSIATPGNYEWGKIEEGRQNNIPDWGAAEHMDLFCNILKCRISLLCPLRPLDPIPQDNNEAKQYST